MVGTAELSNILRERVALSLDRELVAWVDANSQAGAAFGSPSHAIERAIGRLRAEHDFTQETCRKTDVPFHDVYFWRLYADEVRQSQPGPRGRPFKGAPRPGHPKRVRVYATISMEMIAWTDRTCIQKGTFETLSQAVEVGLRRLRSGEHRANLTVEPGLSMERDAFWQLYLRHATATGPKT
jgi:Arc/MetJ-type ribon-helix-helix transcriptional regulator